MISEKLTVKELKEKIVNLQNQSTYQENIIAKQGSIISKDRCLLNLKENEPIFALRAQDRLAPMLIRLWADLTSTQSNRQEKVRHAYLAASQFDDWARINKSQFPD